MQHESKAGSQRNTFQMHVHRRVRRHSEIVECVSVDNDRNSCGFLKVVNNLAERRVIEQQPDARIECGFDFRSGRLVNSTDCAEGSSTRVVRQAARFAVPSTQEYPVVCEPLRAAAALVRSRTGPPTPGV